MLAEAESHLLAAAEDGRGRGLDAEVGGLLLLVAWLIVRRVVALRAPRPILLIVPFGRTALVLTAYGVLGLLQQAQSWALSCLVAAAASVAALVKKNAAPGRARGGISV